MDSPTQAQQPPSIDPMTVISPMRSVADIVVIYDGGNWDPENPRWTGWSLVSLTWDGQPNSIGCRWNGQLGVTPGTPSSRGYPTWFIIPDPFASMMVAVVKRYEDGGGSAALANPLRHAVNEMIAAARAATMDEITRLQLPLASLARAD